VPPLDKTIRHGTPLKLARTYCGGNACRQSGTGAGMDSTGQIPLGDGKSDSRFTV
jgi:hypothetical protein